MSRALIAVLVAGATLCNETEALRVRVRSSRSDPAGLTYLVLCRSHGNHAEEYDNCKKLVRMVRAGGESWNVLCERQGLRVRCKRLGVVVVKKMRAWEATILVHLMTL